MKDITKIKGKQQSIEFGVKSMDNIRRGISYVVDIVSITYGARGKNVLIKYDDNSGVISTNDGVTVVNSIKNMKSPMDMGIQLIKQVCKRTDDTAGDGTTLTALLSKSLVEAVYPSLVSNQLNYLEISKSIKQIKQILIDKLESDTNMISKTQEIQNIANIASGDEKLGKLISSAFHHVGKDGTVMVENSKSFNTKLVVEEGTKIDGGFVSHSFLNNKTDIVLNNVSILITDFSINTQKDIVNLLKHAATTNKTILLVCNGIDAGPMITIMMNKSYAKIYVVKLPSFGDEREHIIEDLILKCGGKAILTKFNKSFIFTEESFGFSNTVKINNEQTIFLEGQGYIEAIKQKVNKIKIEQLSENISNDRKNILRQSLSRLTGKIAVIKIGGSTISDIEETKLRLEDGIHSVKTSVKHGYCVGGGKTLINLIKHLENKIVLSDDFNHTLKLVTNLVIEALLFPFTIMCRNSMLNDRLILKKLLNFTTEQKDFSIDFKNGNIINLLSEGIIDSTYATKVAIINAFSLLDLFIKHGGSILNITNKDQDTISMV